MFTRFNGNVVPFADDATSTNRTVFGGVTQSDAIDDNLNADFKKGWEIVGLNDNPTREDFNAMGYTLGALISYLYEMGIAEWNDKQKYKKYSRVIGSDGKIYKALTGTTGTPNVNHNPTSDVVNWTSETLTDYSTLTNKATPIDSDLLALGDSESSFSLKKLTWANLKATLKTYFDSLYNFYNPTPIISTGTATFTATTNNINLTGIGVDVEIGDVIKISGAIDAKNNSEFTVEVITDANNIIVNQAHANKGTTKNVAAQVSDDGVTVKLLSKWYNAPLGLGQGWVGVAASRSAGVTYTNNTGKPVTALISFNINANSNSISIDGVKISETSGYLLGEGSGNAYVGHSMMVVIPKGSTYVANTNISIALWSELR